MAYWNDSVTENPKPVSMMVRLMFTPIILRSIPRKTVTGIKHDHYHTDNSGNRSEVHGMEGRNWDTRQN